MNTDRVHTTLLTLFKKRRRRTLYLGGFLAIIFLTVAFFSSDYLLVTPVEGGSFSEGMVGYPRFINPILAQSHTDKDLSQLLFSGLLKKDSQGIYIPELADALEIGENETQYILSLKENVSFHDGTPITTEDVMFTYSLAQDPLMKSPLYPKLLRVDISPSENGDIVFTLPEPQSDFEENLTLGIMSKEQWQDISIEEFPFAEQNITPVGSGPYKMQNITRDNKQKISNFLLAAYRENALAPYIDTITIKFYEDQTQALDAFENGLVDNFGNISAQELLSLDRSLEDKNIQTQPLSRVFLLFFNPNQSLLLDKKIIRESIRDAVNKQEIIDSVFFTRASIADGPLPSSHSKYVASETVTRTNDQVIADLEKAGWKKNSDGVFELATNDSTLEARFTLHVPDVAELQKSAELVKESLALVSIQADIVIVPEKEFTTDVIRKREFESVLFGQIIEEPSHLYGFWHSSGVDDPGVNISGYQNNTVDTILDRLLLQSQDEEKTLQDYTNFQKQIRKDSPVVFLFTPHFIYASDKNIQQNNIKNISFSSDRFEYISDWYIDTESILPWFDVDNL